VNRRYLARTQFFDRFTTDTRTDFLGTAGITAFVPFCPSRYYRKKYEVAALMVLSENNTV
jgi:hypothetical protein